MKIYRTAMLVFTLMATTYLLVAAAPASAQIYEDFSISPSGFGYPSYIRHCEPLVVDVTADNDGDQAVVYSVSAEEDPSPYSGWLDVTGFGGYLEPYSFETGQVTLNNNYVICDFGTVVKVTGRVVFDLSSMGADTFHIELIVADTVAMPVWDTISTTCTQLVVSSHGSAGLGGIGGANLDYADENVGEWRDDANAYLFDASTVIGYVSDADTVMNWASSGTTIADPHSLIPIHDTTALGRVRSHFTETWADGFYTGLYTNHDSTIALETFWYANTDPFYSCGFVVKLTKVYSLDMEAHDSLIVGEVVDWNIPADSNSNDNTSGTGFDLTPAVWNLVYQQGTEYAGWNDDEEDAFGGWDETERYGAMYFIRGWEYDENGSQTAIFTDPYGMYTADNAECGNPTSPGLDGDSLFKNHSISGQTISDSVETDLHMGMTYLFKHNLEAGDTLYLCTAYMTTMSSTFPTASGGPGLAALAQDAWNFVSQYSIPEPDIECIQPGDANLDYSVNISDLTFFVDYMFAGGPRPPCPEQFDNDNNCSVDISDLTYYVDFMFSGGPPPMECLNCPNLH